MTTAKEPVDQTRLALAALAACIVQALGEREAAALEGFEKNLGKIYQSLRDAPAANVGAMETLTWTRQFLTELKH